MPHGDCPSLKFQRRCSCKAVVVVVDIVDVGMIAVERDVVGTKAAAEATANKSNNKDRTRIIIIVVKRNLI